VTFRLETLESRPDLVLVVAGWLFAEWGERRPGSSLEGAVLRLASRLPQVWIALADAEPLATASLVEAEEEADPAGPWLTSVYTVPSARGRGCATALIARVEAEARRRGHDRLLLATALPGFYHRLGWRLTLSSRYGEAVMIKCLRPD